MTISSNLIDSYDQAVAFLEARIGHGVKPGLERIAAALEVMTDPQEAYPTIHVAGTNGKTTTVRMLDALLTAAGLRTGSYVSPHLFAIEDRYTLGMKPFDREAFADAVADVAPFIEHYESSAGTTLTYFETTVAVAFQAFAAAGVDVAVVEVGLGGRLDATNVVNAAVSVITGIGMDHMEYLGESISAIAAEKAAILKEEGRLITGPLPPGAEGAITAQVAATNSRWLRFGADFNTADVRRAVSGWQCDVEGVFSTYAELYLPLHGRHQVDHLATAIVSAEIFLDRALDHDHLTSALASLTSPGRLQVISRRPLVLVDGAHNAQGLEGLRAAIVAEFPATERVLVFGIRGPRDVADLLAPFAGVFSAVYVTAADDPDAVPTSQVAAAARRALGDEIRIEEVTPVGQAVTEALHASGEDDMVVVAGSLYVVGEAMHRLGAV